MDVISCKTVLLHYKQHCKKGGEKATSSPGRFSMALEVGLQSQGKGALGTRLGKVVFQLAMVSNFVRKSAKNRYFSLIVMCLTKFCPMFSCYNWATLLLCSIIDMVHVFGETKVSHSKIQFLWWWGRKRNLPSESSEKFPSSTNGWDSNSRPSAFWDHSATGALYGKWVVI